LIMTGSSVNGLTHTPPQPSDVALERRLLNSHWNFREFSRDGFPPHRHLPWLPAQVPGSVFLDLIDGGVIPNPFERFYERDVEWVDNAAWEYETKFDVTNLTSAHRYLKFYGLDTIATIELNGTVLGSTDNMYIPHEFSVDGVLVEGENVLRVIFQSALITGDKRRTAYNTYYNESFPDEWDRWNSRSFVRKAQYMYGWDWGPVLIGAGIWQKVELVTVPATEILDWKVDYEFDGTAAIVNASATVRGAFPNDGSSLSFTINVDGVAHKVLTAVPSAAGENLVTFPEFRVTVDRWQPNGLGAQPLYDITLSLFSDSTGDVIDSLPAKVGFRTIKLLHEADADGKGEGFAFEVNGSKVFIKGANWIPNDSFPSRSGEYDVRQRLTQARDAGFNMLRVWGGGFYETDAFYDIADELGLLVWQDFPYGCAYYPDDALYAAAARVEAVAGVRRIRHHASLALWCGNNENHTMFQDGWGGIRPAHFLGEILYHDVLPGVVAAEDPKTGYWPSSPYGGEHANSEDFGDCHNWDVWHGRGDWINYSSNNSRFCSEFGFASSCGLAAWDSVLRPEDRSSRSPVVQWHDKTRKGYETYLGYVALHFPESVSIDDLVYFTQLNQAEALKYGVEHYRRNKGRCWGTLYWQLNDCWPVQSWAVIDSLGEPKAAYYASKRFYAPILLSIVRRENEIDIHLINDLLAEKSGEVSLKLIGFDGKVLHSDVFSVTAASNSAALLRTVEVPELEAYAETAFLLAEFVTSDGNDKASNVLLLIEPKDLNIGPVSIASRQEVLANGDIKLIVSSDSFAPYVWIAAEDHTPLTLSDNFFHLLPGQPREITLSYLHANERPLKDVSIVIRALEPPAK
jgi:beta-mannosidase